MVEIVFIFQYFQQKTMIESFLVSVVSISYLEQTPLIESDVYRYIQTNNRDVLTLANVYIRQGYLGKGLTTRTAYARYFFWFL